MEQCRRGPERFIQSGDTVMWEDLELRFSKSTR
jgi:hypothetical protein